MDATDTWINRNKIMSRFLVENGLPFTVFADNSKRRTIFEVGVLQEQVYSLTTKTTEAEFEGYLRVIKQSLYN